MPYEMQNEEEKEILTPQQEFVKLLSVVDVYDKSDFPFNPAMITSHLATSHITPEQQKKILVMLRESNNLNDFGRFKIYAKRFSDMIMPELLLSKSTMRINRQTLLDRLFVSEQHVRQTISNDEVRQAPQKRGGVFQTLFGVNR